MQEVYRALPRHFRHEAGHYYRDSLIGLVTNGRDIPKHLAHYPHIIDTLETAHAYRLSIDPAVDREFPLTVDVKSFNLDMGLSAPLPFVISAPVIKKLQFIRSVCYCHRKSQRSNK